MMSGFPPTQGLRKVASTGLSGYAKANVGLTTIMAYTAPNDGNLHTVVFSYRLIILTTETGGGIFVDLTAGTLPHSIAGSGFYVDNGNNAGPADVFVRNALPPFVIGPGEAVALQQTSALTAGSSTVYAEFWSS